MKFAAGERLKANKTENPIAECSLPLGHGAHYQQDEARRYDDGHFRFDG
jgi:hypothetical protein